jgi:hypothetical protein
MTTKRTLLLLIRTLHIYLSMLALLLLLFFSVTGFLMNHPERFGIDSTTTHDSSTILPVNIVTPEAGTPHPDLALVEYLRANCGARGAADMSFSLDDDPVRVTFKGPHYRFDAEINKADGKTTITRTASSLTGFLGHLHKGEDTGQAWHRVLDATSILLAVISLTGLLLWMTLAKRRTLGLIALVVSLGACLGVLLMFVP